MEKTNFGHSTKNIPIPANQEYSKRLIEMTEKLIKRMRWRAHFFLNAKDNLTTRNNYGFNSKASPPQVPQLREFEYKMATLIHNIEFRKVHLTEFENSLANHIHDIRGDDTNLFIPADKTTNYYKMSASEYQSLLKKNVEKEYKKAPRNTEKSINAKAKQIACKLGIGDRVEVLPRRNSFITLKDHKDNFQNNPSCRLINPAKSELGKVSKHILDRINRAVIENTGVQQWKSTKATLSWFNAIANKSQHSFISFDIVNFYPSITRDLLHKALDFAATFISITPGERDIIMHTKQSLLFHNDDAWSKKNSVDSFDVTMGSYDGAEVCELVGAYLLCQLPKEIGRDKIGLYRDDGLAAFRTTARKIEEIKKKICKVFANNQLQITIEANKKIVNFLDVTLNLNNGSFTPYVKPNNTPLYVHRESNHPPAILKNIPLAINQRLNETSSCQQSFDAVAPIYQQALNKSGYRYTLKYDKQSRERAPETKNRARNVTWYNPPFSKHVATNVGKKFLSIVRGTFTNGHPLKQIFNKNTLKLSYSCMPNLQAKISSHNKAILRKTHENKDEHQPCNCRDKSACPLNGECLTTNLIYQATVETSTAKETYIGLTQNKFKTRYTNHLASFRDESKMNATQLSKHIWALKDKGISYNLSWKIIARAQPYTNVNKRCNLCITEKFFIICKPHMCTLNSRNELANKCRHGGKLLLQNT